MQALMALAGSAKHPPSIGKSGEQFGHFADQC
jgi:hypothetical protein